MSFTYKIIEDDTRLRIEICIANTSNLTHILKSTIIGYSLTDENGRCNIIIYLNSGKEFNLTDSMVGTHSRHTLQVLFRIENGGKSIRGDLRNCLDNILAPKKLDLLDIKDLLVG